MAHRKPLGTTFTITLDWAGPSPQIHDALVSQAGTWYRVVGLEETRNRQRPRIVLERVAEPEEQLTDRTLIWDDRYVGMIHQFAWYPRDRKRAAA